MNLSGVIACALACAVTATGASAQSSPAREQSVVVDLGLSTSEIERNVSLILAAGQTMNRAADMGLDRLFKRREGSGWKRSLGRFGALYLVNLPLASITHTLSHEVGHIGRGHDAGLRVSFLDITWPWPVPSTGAVVGMDGELEQDDEVLGLIGGGEEGADVLSRTLVESIYRRDRTNYFDWAVYLYAKLDMPIYSWTSLRPSTLESFERLYGSSPGDPKQYAIVYSGLACDPDDIERRLAERRANGLPPPGGAGCPSLASVQSIGGEIRRGSWLDLADYTFIAGFTRVVQYLVTGQRESSNAALRIGGLRLLPAMHYTLTPLGVERGANVGVVTDTRLIQSDVRWIDTPIGDRLWGAGVSVLPRMNDRFMPSIRVDSWQRVDESPGFRLELGGDWRVSAGGRRIPVNVAVGYKTAGYLAGHPRGAGFTLSGGTQFRF